MDVLIDNKDIKGVYGITVLDYTAALDFAAERENSRTWQDKSGIEKNLSNVRYEPKEFVLSCYCKADNEVLAYSLIDTLVTYMFTKGVFVLSLRDGSKGIQEAFLCERSSTIVGSIGIRLQNSLYQFKLGLRDVNPNAVKYKTSIVGGVSSILYEKGRTAIIYWGNGDRGFVSNSALYTKSDYADDGLVDVIIDIDKNTEIVPALVADFSADVTLGIKVQDVQFTDESIGTVIIWSWDFGDGLTSAEQSPLHTYTEPGVYTVTLQIFNDSGGFDSITKTSYIVIRNAWMKRSDTEFILRNNTDKISNN